MISLKEAKNQLESKKKSIVINKEIACDLITPVQTLLKIKKYFADYHFLYESVEKGSSKGRYSVIGLMPDLVFKSERNLAFINRNLNLESKEFIKIENPNPIEALRDLINESKIESESSILSSGLFGYMSYDMVRLMEEIPNNNLEDEINIPDSTFIRPQILIVFDNIFDIATISSPIYYHENLNVNLAYEKAQKNIDYIIDLINQEEVKIQNNTAKDKNKIKYSFSSSKKEYCNMVKKVKNYIVEGDIFQALPSLRASAEFKQEDSFALYRSLRSVNPSPFLFYLQFPDFSFMGSSPEIMVSLKNDKVTIRPLAGTRKRGKNEAEDKEIAQDLLLDKKELSEHLMLIDLGRHDVGRVCQASTVKVTEKMIIENYSHVMHISSNVQGVIKDDNDALDALIGGFPAGTVSGAPKIRAMEIIEEIEDKKRSFYAGCVGYFAGNGDMETCITLRSALIKNDKIYLQAGAGVVYDSIPEKEYEECQNKLAALISAIDKIDKYIH